MPIAGPVPRPTYPPVNVINTCVRIFRGGGGGGGISLCLVGIESSRVGGLSYRKSLSQPMDIHLTSPHHHTRYSPAHTTLPSFLPPITLLPLPLTPPIPHEANMYVPLPPSLTSKPSTHSTNEPNRHFNQKKRKLHPYLHTYPS